MSYYLPKSYARNWAPRECLEWRGRTLAGVGAFGYFIILMQKYSPHRGVRMKIAIAAGFCCIASAGIAAPSAFVSYHKLGFLQKGILGSGYREKVLAPRSWRVTGKTGGERYNGPATQWIAVYRSAELVKSVGAKYYRITNWNGNGLQAYAGAGMMLNIGNEFTMDVEATDTPDEAYHCADRVLRGECRTVDAEAAMQEIRPFLRFKSK